MTHGNVTHMNHERLASRYPVELPPELFEFWDFACGTGGLLAELGIDIDGPFTLLAGKELRGDWPRYYRDPPELFTVMTGTIDGLHWGYWYDAPGEMPPVVASYHHSDAYELRATATLFEAVREELEWRWAGDERAKLEEPDEASEIDRRLEDYAKLREQLSNYALKDREEIGDAYTKKYVHTTQQKLPREALAKTRNGMGIVAKPSQYRALPGKDRFVEQHDYVPSARDVETMVSFAIEAASDGKPATALKLGHDLWPYSEHEAQAYAMLRLAYEGLGRTVLASVLDEAIAFRKRCDAQR